MRHPLLLIAGGAFWNLGVLLGVGGILAGDSTGYEWLEFPPYAAIVLFVAYSLVVSWALLMFRFRRGDHIYITQWYLLGAFLWFPWVYGATQIMLFVSPVAGRDAGSGDLVVREQSSFPLVRRDRARHRVLHDPEGDRTSGLQLPAGGDRILDLCALRQLDWNATARRRTVSSLDDYGQHRCHDPDHHSGGDGRTESSHDDARVLWSDCDTARRCVSPSLVRSAYTVFSLVGVLLSLRSVAGYVHFTEASIAYSHLGLYAFFTMVMFGSMYYIVPRLVGREWRYASLIKLHFWSSTYGVGLMVLMLLVGGLAQGASLHDPIARFQREH